MGLEKEEPSSSHIASDHQDLATHIAGSRYRRLDLDLVLKRPLIMLWAAKLHILSIVFVFSDAHHS